MLLVVLCYLAGVPTLAPTVGAMSWPNPLQRPLTHMGQPGNWPSKQRFLLDLLLQVHKPLLQRQLIEMGNELNVDPTNYEEGAFPPLAEFIQRVRAGRVLGPFAIYSQMAEELPQQLLGVYRFLVLAKDWANFQRNACFARIHFNALLFVNALQLALRDRHDTQSLQLPAMHELLPQLYYERDVIAAAQQVYWQELELASVSEKTSWQRLLERFLQSKSFLPRRKPAMRRAQLEPGNALVIEVKQPTTLSCDVGLNSYWNNVVNRQLLLAAQAMEAQSDAADTADDGEGPRWRLGKRFKIIDGDRMMAFRGPSDERAFQMEHNQAECFHGQILVANLQQLLARLQLEQLANGKVESDLETELILPQMLITGSVPYKATPLDAQSVRQLIARAVQDVAKEIESSTQDALLPDETLAARYWQLHRQLSLAVNGEGTQPSLLGIATSNLRDPIYRQLLLQLLPKLEQHTVRPLASSVAPGQKVSVKRIAVGRLQTFEELVDADLINLMDQQLLETQGNNLQLLRRRLVARQWRLNHRSFNISYELHTQQTQVVLVRSFLQANSSLTGPAPLLLDSFVQQLQAGANRMTRNSLTDIKWTSRDANTLSELYEAQAAQPLSSYAPCGWPHRLLLPRGTAAGLPMQLLVLVTPWPAAAAADTSRMSEGCGCGWGSAELSRGSDLLVTGSAVRDVIIEHIKP